MIALILVAGNSRRMGSITENCHKTLLEVGNKPILGRMLEALEAVGIKKVCFVHGYRSGQIKDYVEKNYADFEYIWVENPIYSETNTAYSVWLTESALKDEGEDIILINGDVVLDYRSFEITIEAEGKNVLAVRHGHVAEEEVKVTLDEEGNITEIGKHLAPEICAGESVGINRLSSEILPDLYATFKDRIENGNGKKEFYEASFDALVQNGKRFNTCDVSQVPVMEIDTPEDYQEVKASLVSQLISKK